VYHAGSLWDGLEMGAPADVHCYTPDEFERKRATLPRVRDTVETGIDLMAPGNSAPNVGASSHDGAEFP
jgi:hypothetical protein